jgi:ribose 5-phosphate isomerase A
MDQDEAKRSAARAALKWLPQTGVIGIGTGSTARFFIEALAEWMQAQTEPTFRAVPTSEESRRLADQANIPLLDDEGPWTIDVCVDGADEVSDALDLIKGGGGSHAREKIVNHSSRTNIIIVDEGKLSRKLGEKRAVPVEVLRFGHQATARALARFGRPALRLRSGARYLTDSGNYIYDVTTGPIERPRELEQAVNEVPGVVAVGLFCGRVDLVIVAGAGTVREFRR